MFLLARQAADRGWKVLVTTSTRMLIPSAGQYDQLDLSGKLFTGATVDAPGVYVGGIPDSAEGKMRGAREDYLSFQQKVFDLVLVEADGSAGKPLKGWNATEPVIPAATSKTIGVVDIQTIGETISNRLVHRLELFTRLTGGEPGEKVALGHLLRMICLDEGLFAQSLGEEILYINKVESERDRQQADILRCQLDNLKVVAGSVRQGTIHG